MKLQVDTTRKVSKLDILKNLFSPIEGKPQFCCIKMLQKVC